MYHACLRAYDQSSDREGLIVSLRLSDEMVLQIIQSLEPGGSISVSLTDHAQDQNGQAVHVSLEWVPALASFSATVHGRPSGYIPYDELIGSVGQVLPMDGQPCMVCLCGTLDVYRRGMLNIETGLVSVFTKSAGLSFLGAHAFLSGNAPSRFDGVRIQLDKGDASRAPLRVPSHQLYRLQGGYSTREARAIPPTADVSLDRLMAMTSRVSAFYKDAKLG